MTVEAAVAPPSGPLRFARFAFPPHRLGYCGPSDQGGCTDLAAFATGGDDPGVRHLARGFEGAYPYLELLAGAGGRDDPLDAEVVEAYWIGNELLREVSVHDLGNSLDERFRRRAGGDWRWIERRIPVGTPNHSFHVLHAMPWAGLMRDGIVDEPLSIVDRCRISWATVVEGGRRPLVRRTPLRWSGSSLVVGDPVVEPVDSAVDVVPGDRVAIHWNWVCERLTPTQLGWLQRVTLAQLEGLHAG